MGVYQKLLNIQSVLKCAKSQYNSFGKYNYRSCEDILEAAKPICHAAQCVLTVSDDIVFVGDRFYIKATATLTDVVSGESIKNTAFAREEESKKGMDGSQITGTASSYARKYCLNGLFCLDDTKDADTNEYHNTLERKVKPAVKKEIPAEVQDLPWTPASKVMIIKGLVNRKGADADKLLQYFKVKSVEDMSEADMDKCIAMLQTKPDID